MAKLIIRTDVSLCSGRGCPEDYRAKCYRYLVGEALNKRKAPVRDLIWWIEPQCKVNFRGKAHCPMQMEPMMK